MHGGTKPRKKAMWSQGEISPCDHIICLRYSVASCLRVEAKPFTEAIASHLQVDRQPRLPRLAELLHHSLVGGMVGVALEGIEIIDLHLEDEGPLLHAVEVLVDARRDGADLGDL